MDTKTQTMNDDKVYLSKEGFDELREKLNDLKTKRRIEIAQHLEFAKSLGDLSENAEYAEAKDEQMVNESEILKLEDLMARAEVISHTMTPEVRIGSTVFFERKGARQQFVIVSKEEADPLKGKISHESPLGKAFLGRKKNEKILVSTPKGQQEYHIIDVG
ncbi:MAG: transcription elongation factor GreA [Patescibacteria group bacterium]